MYMYTCKKLLLICPFKQRREGEGGSKFSGYVRKELKFFTTPIREETHKRSGFLSGRTTKVLPSLH